MTVKIVLSSVAPPCGQNGSKSMNVRWFDFVKLKVDLRKFLRTASGAMRRFSKVEKASTKRCPPCPGPSEKEIPCTMATFCGKKVQLSNVRARFMSVKPGKEFKIRKISSTRGVTESFLNSK